MQEMLRGDEEPLTVEAIEEMLGSGASPQLHGEQADNTEALLKLLESSETPYEAADSSLEKKIEEDEEGGRATRQAITAARVIHESRKLAERRKEGSEEGERRRVAPDGERTRGSSLVPTQRESAIVGRHRKEHTVTLRLSFI